MPQIKTLSQFLRRVISLRRRAKDLWYRGINDASLSVSPGLYWREFESEWDLASGFISQAPQFLSESQKIRFAGELEAPWEWYFLMQHYGMPTRLIDWTESPLVALYFALKEFESSRAPATSPCIWILEPNRLNLRTIQFEGVVVPGGEFSQHWLYQTDSSEHKRCRPTRPCEFEHGGKKYSNALPMAIYPVRSNPRILAQQGVFTVHGASVSSLDEAFGVTRKKPRAALDKLIKLEIDRGSAATIRKDLEAIQIHDLALFPELPNLANRLRERAIRELSNGKAMA